jgi:RecA-family ATPase
MEGWDYSDMWLERGPDETAQALKIESVISQVFFPYDAKPQLSSNYLMKGWFGEGQMSVIYGPSNVGKSFFVLDIAWHISANEAWNNNKVSGGSVLYLATEGGMAFHNRVVAMRQHYSFHKDVKLAVRPSPVNMLDADVDMNVLAKLCREVSRIHGTVKMIVIDTLSRAMSGANENSPEDMTKFIGNCDQLRELTGAHVATVHHSGKDKAAGARGHSSLRAATDTEIELDYNEETGLRTAKATKQRDLETGAIFNFKLKVIELGQDDDGDAVTTCVIEKASSEEVEEASRPQIKGKNQTLLRSVFKQLRSEGLGNPNPGGVGWPEPRAYHVISEETVKDHFIGKCSSASNPKTSYKQALTSLIGSGHVAMNDGFMWFTDNSGKAKQRIE